MQVYIGAQDCSGLACYTRHWEH